MTKRQDLCLQRRSRPEQSDQRQANQPANISHQPRASPDSTSLASRIEFPDMSRGRGNSAGHSAVLGSASSVHNTRCKPDRPGRRWRLQRSRSLSHCGGAAEASTEAHAPSAMAVMEVFDMRTSATGIHKRLADCAQLMGLVGMLLSSPAVADIYPVRGVWVAQNRDFPIGPNEACFTVRLSGIEAVARKLISQLLIFNESKRYEVKQNLQTVST